MAFSLYRKYRPETFTDVVGQEHVEQTLCNAVATNSVSHAYLFCGPRGTGKTTTARLLAKALLCNQAPTANPDGTCEQCLEIAQGVHPDVYELDAASRTGVENMREEVIARVPFAPTRGSHKIYIIDEVHMLSTAAFNALLKTIEEPPSHVIFVFCTTDPQKVPQTILSRCQRFDFHRLSEQEIVKRLRHICDQEGFTAEPRALELIAQRSQGGMRDAISSLEQVAVFGGGAVTASAAQDLLGEVTGNQLFGIADLIATRDVAGCFGWVASFAQSGTDIAQFTRDLTMHIRNLYVVAVTGAGANLAEILEVDTETIGLYEDQVSSFGSTDRLSHALVVLGDLSTELRTAANARLSLEIALTRMTRPQSDLTLEALAARLDIVEQNGGALQAHTPSTVIPAAEPWESMVPPQAEPLSSNAHGVPPSPPSTEEPADLNPSAIRRLWLQVEKEVRAKRAGTATMFGGARAHLDPETGGLLIELPTGSSFEKKALERPDNREYVNEAVTAVFGQPLNLRYILGAPTSEDISPLSPTEPTPPTAAAASAENTSPRSPLASSEDTLSLSPPPPPEDIPPPITLTIDPPPIDDPPSDPPSDPLAAPSFDDILRTSFGTSLFIEEIDSTN